MASSHLYGGTFALLSHFLPRTCGITTTFVDIFGEDAEAEIRAALPTARVLYLESISNPTLSVADIPRLSAIAREVSEAIAVVVDNTFAPLILSPARLGADVVVHSISKYISGGADVIAGAVCGPAALIDSMMGLQQGALMLLGPTMNPNVAFGISGSTVRALILRVVISRLRLGEFGCCSCELRPCTTSAARSSACSKNSLSPSNLRLSGMTRPASASMPSAETMT